MNKKNVVVYLSIIAILLIIISGWYAYSFKAYSTSPESFDGARAYEDVITQVNMGPRTPGSEGHAQIREWMRTELENAGWTVDVHESERLGHPIYNFIAKRSAELPQVIVAAHYDTRFVSDNDPDPAKQTEPVPGANDGASGMAVLLELARTLPDDTVPVWLVFFDAEDNGRVDGWDWILGSRAFVDEIPVRPEAVVIVDMIGDANLNIHYENNSDPIIRAEIWDTATQLGYGEVFIADEKYNMIDDHTPFVERGIPAVDIIDFDYAYWHTTSDTPDKVSPDSLHAVGDTLWHWVAAK